MKKEIVACSDCFQRHGLKLMAERYGVKDGQPCPLCGSCTGAKLTREQARDLAGDYIVNGSYHNTIFGGSPIYMLSDAGQDDNVFDDDPDLTLLQEISSLCTFLYAPATWRVGFTVWLEDLSSASRLVRAKTIRKIIDYCDKTRCVEGSMYYRLLSRLYGESRDPLTFDSPHWKYQNKGRFRLREHNVLYLSSNVESAIHECRVTVEDELTLASIVVKKPLMVLDLTEPMQHSVDPSEDLSYSLGFVCSAGKDAYPITRAIAREAFNQGLDGVLYWSYFNRVSSERGKNLVLFGSPIKEGKVEVVSIDRLLLEQIKYSYSLGVLI